jgi:PIN domain nuclease of toxin-antitoxin system
MKDLVLDTHVFLWLLEGNPKLPVTLRQAIEDETNRFPGLFW